MRKKYILLVLMVAILSLVSCNLDNEGIIRRGFTRAPSDNKDRSFIGYNSDENALYYVTADLELVKGNLNGNETAISSNSIFHTYQQDITWYDESENQILYIDDNPNEEQRFYLISLNNEVSITPLTLSGLKSGYKVKTVFEGDNGAGVLVASKADNDNNDHAILYSFSTSDDSIELANMGETPQNEYFFSCKNGLLITTTKNNNLEITGYKYYYKAFNTEINLNGNPNGVSVRSVTEDDAGNIYIVTSSSIYKGSTNSSFTRYSTSVGYANTYQIPSVISDDNKLIILRDNGSHSPSILYTVEFTDEGDTHSVSLKQSTTLNNVVAEAFVKTSDNGIYMLSKDHGLFKIGNNSITRL